MENERVLFHFVRSRHFRVVHADGAVGAPTPRGLIGAAVAGLFGEAVGDTIGAVVGVIANTGLRFATNKRGIHSVSKPYKPPP